jgi:uncharacterized protein YfaS (alpha-2-macroglobulin family)
MWGFKRGAVIIAAVALLLGFGGGYLTAHVAPSAHAGSNSTGFIWPFFGKPRAADAPRAGVRKPDGFAVWTTRIDATRADPISCVRMTRALDPRKSYADFVLVSPDLGHPTAATINNDELCVPGLGYSGHQLTLLKGLPAADGETLTDDVKVDFSGASQPPYVGFDGQGVILPREEADGIGIDTVNVSSLHVEVWRIADRNLVRKTIAASDPTAEGEYGYEGDVQADGRSVWKGEVLVKAVGGQRAVTVFPLGAVLKDMKPGAYMITARDASGVLSDQSKAKHGDDQDRPARARRWVLFTDMGLSAYDGADALDVLVRSLKTAKAMPGVRMALVANDGEELASEQSDADGHVRFNHALLDGEGAAKAKKVMAYGPGSDFTLLDLDRSPLDLSSQLKGETGRVLPGVTSTVGRAAAASVDGYLYTDRGIYRPGEAVHLVAMMRDRLSRAVKDRKGALVIRRPSGTEFRRLRFDRSPDGAVVRDIVLPAAAPRGAWTVTLQMDGSDDPSGEARFEVQDFAPQRLAVTVTGDGDKPMVAGETRKIQVNARFLYGAPGAGLQAEIEARLGPDTNPFPQFKDFRWGDEQTAFSEKLVQPPKTTTDNAGNTSFALAFPEAADAAQPLKADISASVLEPGGRAVTEAAGVKVRSKPLYFGVRITQGSLGEEQTQTYDVIAVDAFGRRVAAHKSKWTLISENWTYDWFEKDGRWGFHRTSRDSVIAAGALEVGAERAARITKRLPWGDYRLVLEDPATGARTVIRQSSGWNSDASDEDAPDAARLSVGDKTYASGDTVPLHIQAPFGGEAEIAVASDRVIQLKTVSVPKGGATIQMPVTAAWGGGAYILVSVMEPRNPTTAPKPRRALGVAYVPIQPKGKVLTVSLAAPAKLNSHTPIDVPVQVKGLSLGASAYVTLAAVDEGILRLTHQANPDPVKWYFGRRALTVDYRDDYGRLLNPNLGAPAVVNYGGDEAGGEGLSATPIKTVALWSGLVKTEADGRAIIHLPPGAYNGQLRLMAVAWTDDAVGGGQESVLVREPVVAELDLLRFLAPGDRADIGLELHNVEGKVGAYTAEIIGQGGLTAPFRKLYNLALGQRVLDHPTLAAPDRPSIGAVTLKVTGPGFADTVSYPLQTRVGWSGITRDTSVLQKPGEAFTPTPDLLKGLSRGGLSMTVSYSPFRGLDPAPIAEALQRYPYGCSEQLVSVAYPLLFAQEISNAEKFRRTPAALTDAVIKLLDREGADGAFGLWHPGDSEADAWLGAYIVDFLIAARDHGQAVPQDALQRALHGMRLISKPDDRPSIDYRLEYPGFWGGPDLTKRMRSRAAAYALYDLAKARQGDLPRLRWFHDVQFADEPSPLAKAQVGAGLAMMGDRGRAHDSFVQAAKSLDYREPTDWYQSRLRDLAGVIALAYEAGEPDIARGLQVGLEGKIRGPDDLNTQEQARLLMAAHAMLAAAGPIRIEARGVQPMAGSGARWAVGRLADARFVNQGTGALWRTVTVHGLPNVAPKADGHGIVLQKTFYAPDGRPLDPAALTQGQRVVVRISGSSEQSRAMQMVIDDALPAGFEIETILQPADADTTANTDNNLGSREQPASKGPFAFLGTLSEPSLQEKRDDRFVAALTVPANTTFTVAYVARAVTPGDFFLPGAMAGDMYRPTISAYTEARRTKITPVK